jgi:hypothetical protein
VEIPETNDNIPPRCMVLLQSQESLDPQSSIKLFENVVAVLDESNT